MLHSKTKVGLIKARSLIDTAVTAGSSTTTPSKRTPLLNPTARPARIHAAATRDEGDRAWEALYDAIEGRTGGNWGGVATWNDDPGRTHAEIMQAFDWAIADLN